MKSIASVLAVIALFPSLFRAEGGESSSQVSQPTGHEHPLTFREALHAANTRKVQEDEGHQAPIPQPGQSDKKSRTFVEIIRINERMMVDEKNKPKAYAARVHNALYTIQSGRIRRLFHSEMLVKPKPGSNILNRIRTNRFAEETPSARDEEPSRLRRWFLRAAAKLHLESFWPRLFVSILLGFLATSLIFAVCYALQWLYVLVTGYRILRDDGEDAGTSTGTFGNDSADRLLHSEQKRMAEVRPLAQ